MTVETHIEQVDFQASGVANLTIAHATHDSYTSFLPALLPVLIEKFSMTNTAAGLLTMFMQLPSLIQPFIGYFADRRNLRILIVLAPIFTGAAMSLLSIAPSYGFLAFLLVLAGVSSASFHATGPGLNSQLSGSKLGRGMSLWMVGGELGRVFGPLVVVSAVGILTMERMPWLMLGGVIVSIFLFGRLKDNKTNSVNDQDEIRWQRALQSMKGVMLPIAVIMFIRSMALATLVTFLPTYLTRTGSSLWMAGASLTIMESAGVAGAFLLGSLSDKFGRRRMLMISFIATPIFMVLFIQSSGLMQFPLLILLGFFAISVVPVIMAIVLENAPENRFLANGIYMAISFVLQAAAVLLVGILADQVDLRFTMLLSAGVLPLALPFILLLPRSKKRVV